MTNPRPVAGFLVVLEPAALSSKIPFFFGENLIGRSESKADVVIKEPSISQKHAKLIATPNKITIRDLSSKNGTKINNEGNYIESQNQVVIDNSMIIYFADAKCRIEIIEINQETRNIQSVTLKVDHKRKQNNNQKEQKIETKPILEKPEKNEFKAVEISNDYDLQQGFQDNKKLEQKLKREKQSKKKSKKNTKSKAQLNGNIDQNNKKIKNIQHQQKNRKFMNPAQTKQSEEQQLKVIKKSPKKGSKEKRKSPEIQQKDVRFLDNKKLQKQFKEPEHNKNKNKDEDQQKEKLDDGAKKKQTKTAKEKKQSKEVQNEEKIKKKIRDEQQKADLSQTLGQKELKKDSKNTEQTSLDNSADTTKKKTKQRKKMPGQSLQRELKLAARRSTLGKRVLFSGFVPKMRRKFFISVEDYNEDFDYLVMKQYTRTFKALVAISKGILIVKNSWIQQSQQSLRTLNAMNYLFYKLQPIYQAIERVKSGFKVFDGYQFYLLSSQYHLKISQIQMLIRNGGGQIKMIKGQVKIKDTRKCIAILRNKQQNAITSELKDEMGRSKKLGFELIYQIEFLLDTSEKQCINWQNSKL